MSAPFWSDLPADCFEGDTFPKNKWHLCRLKGLTLPGRARVRALPTQDYSAQKGPGDEGASIILQGYLPGPIDIELEMWKPEQWEIWQSILAEIWRKPGKVSAGFSARGDDRKSAAKKRDERAQLQAGTVLATEQAISIEHPGLTPYNIHRVVVTGVSPPEPGSSPQSKVVNIKCLEWIPPPATKENETPKKVDSSTNEPSSDEAIFDIPPANSEGVSPGLDPREGGPNGPPRDPNAGKF